MALAKPKLTLILSETWTMTDPRDLKRFVRYAQIAEDAGFYAVMMGEHIVMGPNSCYKGVPRNPRDWLRMGNQPPPYAHPASMITLSAMAALTSRIRLLAAAVIAPLRHPLLLAKEFATLDLISEGRLIVLPGISWQEEEFAALGVSHKSRAAILDEELEIWSKLWREGSPVRYRGKHFQFDDAYIEPQPYRDTGVTLWTGGQALIPPILRRLVAYSQGLFVLQPPTREEHAEIRAAMEAAGRDYDSLEFSALARGEFQGDDDLLDVGRVAEDALRMREEGITNFVFKPSQFIDSGDNLAAFCRDVVNRMGA